MPTRFAAAFTLTVFALTPALADEMAFYLRNNHARAVVVELYSQATPGKVWPGGDQVYLLEKGEKKSVPITCESGEEICYGAWLYGDASRFWGVGPDNVQACEDCCVVCKPKWTKTVDLSP